MAEPDSKQRAFDRLAVALLVFCGAQLFADSPGWLKTLLYALAVTMVLPSVLWRLRRFGLWSVHDPSHHQTGVGIVTPVQVRALLAEWIPNALTMSRPVLGVFSAVWLTQGRLLLAFCAYHAGLITDVLDGAIARRLKGTSAWGKNFDAECDFAFNLIVGLGIAWRLVDMGPDYLRLSWFAVIPVSFIASRFVTKSHTVLAKAHSGFSRVLIATLLWSLLPSDPRPLAGVASLVIFVVSAVYELEVTKQELREKRRTLA